MRALGWRETAVLTMAVGVLVADLTVVAARVDEVVPREVASFRRPARTDDPLADPTTTTTVPPPTTTSTAPTTTAPPTTAPPPTTPPPEIRASLTPRGGPWTLGPHRGLGVWLDVYDWTEELSGGQAPVSSTEIDRMAELGIQTLYIQTAHRRSAADVIEPDRLVKYIDRAHAHGMAVVAWYLPTLEDLEVDLRRLVAAARLPVDGLGVDIESRAIGDPGERTRRLLDLSTRLRQAVGERAIAAITPSAVHLQVVNPGFWPGFPWPQVADTYDAILPMSYWSVRGPEWRSGERYIGENIDRIRASTGRPDVAIHAIGGIADGASVADVQGMVRAIQSRGILGGSLYDWDTSQAAQWDALRPLRAR